MNLCTARESTEVMPFGMCFAGEDALWMVQIERRNHVCARTHRPPSQITPHTSRWVGVGQEQILQQWVCPAGSEGHTNMKI